MQCIPVIFPWVTVLLILLCFSFCGKISLIHDLSCFILIRPSNTEQDSQTWEEEPRCYSCDPKVKCVARFVLAESREKRNFVGTDMVVNERL